MAIIFTFGVGERGVATVRPDANGQLNIHVDGNSDVLGKIDLGGIRPLPYLIYGPNAKQPTLDIPVKPSLIFNQISDADSHKTALARCIELCHKLQGIPVINHPAAVLNSKRDRVSELLQDIPGVRMPRTIRGAPRSPDEVPALLRAAGMDFPFVQRNPGDHNAASMVLVENPGQLDRLHVFPLDGRDFYFTEFVDYSDAEGIFFTQRVILFGGEPYLRHALFSDQWKVNSRSRKFMLEHPEIAAPVAFADRLEQERLPPAAPAFREIARRLELDYFGIDCHIGEDGEVLIFEANANMDMLVDKPNAIFRDRLPGAQQRLLQLIRERSGEALN